MNTENEHEDVGAWMLSYNCKGTCRATDCSEAKQNVVEWNCNFTNPTSCKDCNCLFGCNA